MGDLGNSAKARLNALQLSVCMKSGIEVLAGFPVTVLQWNPYNQNTLYNQDTQGNTIPEINIQDTLSRSQRCPHLGVPLYFIIVATNLKLYFVFPSDTPTGNYMRGGYAPQNTTGGYHMGRGDMHTPTAQPPNAVPHQGHMTQGYGRGHDTTSYHSGAAGYGQAATGGGGAYGAAQSGYNYDNMPQVGGQPPHTANPYAVTPGYSDATSTAG